MTASLLLTLAPSGALCVQHEDHPAIELPRDAALTIKLLTTMLQAAANDEQKHLISTAAAPTWWDIREIARKGDFDQQQSLVRMDCPKCSGKPKEYKHKTGLSCDTCFGAGQIQHVVTKLVPKSRKIKAAKLSLKDLFSDEELAEEIS